MPSKISPNRPGSKAAAQDLLANVTGIIRKEEVDLTEYEPILIKCALTQDWSLAFVQRKNIEFSAGVFKGRARLFRDGAGLNRESTMVDFKIVDGFWSYCY